MTRLVYSDQKRDFAKGVTYQNPRFFDGKVPAHVTSVVVVGDWPRVVASCEEQKIPVQVLKPGETLPPQDDLPAIEPSKEKTIEQKEPADPEEPNDPVDIPDDLEDRSFRELKALVKQVDPEKDVSSKKEAIEFLKNQ